MAVRSMIAVFLSLVLAATAARFDNRENCESHEDYPNVFECAKTGKCLSIDQYHDGKSDCCEDGSQCDDWSDEANYFNHYPSRNTLERPGRHCVGIANSMQCAFTKRCITMDQYRDGVFDCCGPNKQDDCSDHSDEDRVSPPGKCTNAYSLQCAQTGRCLSIVEQPNGRCDCCGPEYDCSNCTDHSDEDPCHPDSWSKVVNGQLKEKFSCQGTCRSMSQLDDDVNDCQYDCVETNDLARATCRANLQSRFEQQAAGWCEMLVKKNNDDPHVAPYHVCTSFGTDSDVNICVDGNKIRDGNYDCNDGSDEDAEKHPDCSEDEKREHCSDDTVKCFTVNESSDQEKGIFCRCPSAQCHLMH